MNRDKLMAMGQLTKQPDAFIVCPACHSLTAEFVTFDKTNGFPIYACDNEHERLIFGKHGQQRSFDRPNWEIYLRIAAKERNEESDYDDILGGRRQK